MDCPQNTSLGSQLSGLGFLARLIQVHARTYPVMCLASAHLFRQPYLVYLLFLPWYQDLCPITHPLEHQCSILYGLLTDH